MLLHLNFHGTNLYACNFCSYIDYKSSKLEEHQRIKHPSQMDGENKLNKITIRNQTTIKKPILPGMYICYSTVNYYTLTLSVQSCSTLLPMSVTYFIIFTIDKQIVEWKCKLCDWDIMYTIPKLAKHLSTAHNISNMFHCTMCFYDHSDYHVLEKHFKLNHPSLSENYLKHDFDKVSSYS